MITLSDSQQIAEILSRRANEIAMYHTEHRDKLPASVEFALTREIDRLRRLADRVNPEMDEDDLRNPPKARGRFADALNAGSGSRSQFDLP
jgi:hypothetical protein